MIKTYEIFTTNHSVIVQAENAIEAIEKAGNPLDLIAIKIADTKDKAHTVTAWVDVKDGLPNERMETVLVFNADDLLHKQHQCIAQYFQQIGDFITGIDNYKVTHWMPLPEPPIKSLKQK